MHQAPEIENGFSEGALLISYMRFDEVKQWEGTSIGRRGVDYENFKLKKAQILLNALEKTFPGIQSKIESFSTSSPLTYLDYTATKEGSMYGVLRDKNFPTQTLVSQRTRIPNLFMTGQNINSHGILGVTIGAIITCAEFLGVNTIIKEINNV
jgi:all-trans-retinol 13,14-reductase